MEPVQRAPVVRDRAEEEESADAVRCPRCELDRDLAEGGRLAIRRAGRELAAWDIAVIANVAPEVRFTDTPTATGAARWVYTLDKEVRASSPAVDGNGWVYIGSYDFRLYVISADGTLIDRFNYGFAISGIASVSGDKPLLIICSSQSIEALEVAGPGK